MKKQLLFAVPILVMLILTISSVTAAAYSSEDILGSWYGQYTGFHNSESVQRYMNMTITDCDAEGNLTGTAGVTTVEGQGYDYEWINYDLKGTFDFSTGSFHMQGTKITSSNGSTSWSMIPFDGTVTDESVSGYCDNNTERSFSFARVSEWAKDEITEANAVGLIPDVLNGEDLSQKISRAEFAAVAVQLYQTLTGTETGTDGARAFIDIAGNAAEEQIKQASALDIVVGVSDTEFEPNTNINREQLATMLCRTIKKYKFADWTFATDDQYYLDSEGVKKFDDDSLISDYAKPSVYYMAKMGIINGIDDTHFAPRNTTSDEEASGYASSTREQAIAMALRIYKLSDLWK